MSFDFLNYCSRLQITQKKLHSLVNICCSFDLKANCGYMMYRNYIVCF